MFIPTLQPTGRPEPIPFMGTGPGKVREFFALLRDELDRFIRVGVTAKR